MSEKLEPLSSQINAIIKSLNGDGSIYFPPGIYELESAIGPIDGVAQNSDIASQKGLPMTAPNDAPKATIAVGDERIKGLRKMVSHALAGFEYRDKNWADLLAVLSAFSAMREELEKVKGENEGLKTWAYDYPKLARKIQTLEAELAEVKAENERLDLYNGILCGEKIALKEENDANKRMADNRLEIIADWEAWAKKAEAELTAARETILSAHDDLLLTTWECPSCGHSESTSDMDVMELYLKPAALRQRKEKGEGE